MEAISNPILLYGACALVGVGIGVALPRKGRNPQVLGALVAAVGLGGLFLWAGIASQGALPNYHFYLFSAIALGGGLRMITHPRPVYAALYFILTILASSGLYVILSAEFMAFALIIVYAGAILITYLFVLMLSTQAPTEEETDALSPYDRFAREPGAATFVGFILIAGLTSLMVTGAPGLDSASAGAAETREGYLERLPGKVERAMQRTEGEDGEMLIARSDEVVSVDASDRTALVRNTDGAERTVPLPADLSLRNVEGVGFELLYAKPGAIEIAGIILLMAMLGAVVLARKKVEMDEEAKLAMAGGDA